jgi:hypothetical protein
MGLRFKSLNRSSQAQASFYGEIIGIDLALSAAENNLLVANPHIMAPKGYMTRMPRTRHVRSAWQLT